ncbi:hypothetical protein D3C85_1158610 [compost metagenome]
MQQRPHGQLFQLRRIHPHIHSDEYRHHTDVHRMDVHLIVLCSDIVKLNENITIFHNLIQQCINRHTDISRIKLFPRLNGGEGLTHLCHHQPLRFIRQNFRNFHIR